jgi:hypothetical protein
VGVGSQVIYADHQGRLSGLLRWGPTLGVVFVQAPLMVTVPAGLIGRVLGRV